MAEYIEREALLESLGSLPPWMMKSNEPYTYEQGIKETYSEIKEVIKQQPTVDIQEVVRCKDCKWGRALGFLVMTSCVVIVSQLCHATAFAVTAKNEQRSDKNN